jgi:hypothetical protein
MQGSNDADAVSKKFSTVPHKLSLKIGAQVSNAFPMNSRTAVGPWYDEEDG